MYVCKRRKENKAAHLPPWPAPLHRPLQRRTRAPTCPCHGAAWSRRAPAKHPAQPAELGHHPTPCAAQRKLPWQQAPKCSSRGPSSQQSGQHRAFIHPNASCFHKRTPQEDSTEGLHVPPARPPPTHHLVSPPRVDPQLQRQLHALIKLGPRQRLRSRVVPGRPGQGRWGGIFRSTERLGCLCCRGAAPRGASLHTARRAFRVRAQKSFCPAPRVHLDRSDSITQRHRLPPRPGLGLDERGQRQAVQRAQTHELGRDGGARLCRLDCRCRLRRRLGCCRCRCRLG